MPGEIKHQWNGTVLTITSDSGTSSSDLRGAKGDDGIRGPQGLPGECLHRHELTLTEEQQQTARKNINAYRAINEKENLIEFEANAGLALSAVSAIEPTQAGTGEASPDNVRAISGFDKVELTAVGKNLFNYNARIIGCELSQSMGTTYESNEWYTSDYIPVKPGSNLVLSGLSSNTAIYYDKDKKYISYTQTTNFIVPENAYYIRVNSRIEGYTTPQIEHGETATAYEPYKGTSTSVNLPSTVYGGSYDWKTGKLVSNGAVIDGGSLNWTYMYDYMFYTSTSNYDKIKNIVCEIYPKRDGDKDGLFLLPDAPTVIYIRDTTLTNGTAGATELKQKLTGYKIYYELETPIETYLTPYDFETIEGLNTVWSNTGETTITNLKGNAEALRNLMERIAALEDNIGG